MKKTGLVKRCPRCGREGEVFVDSERNRFMVAWQNPPVEDISSGQDSVNIRDLVDPDFGCGYDALYAKVDTVADQAAALQQLREDNAKLIERARDADARAASAAESLCGIAESECSWRARALVAEAAVAKLEGGRTP